MILNCLIIDDEGIARRGIEKYIRQIPFLHTIASVRSTSEAEKYLLEQKIDLLLLDIQMPQLTGIDFLKTLLHPPPTIIISAYPEYALEGFALDVIDYIVKPVSFERFSKGCQKAKELVELRELKVADSIHHDYFFVKTNGRIEKIILEEILFVAANENYSTIYTTTSKYMVLMNLKGFETKLDSVRFMRVHKSFIVSLAKIDRVQGTSLTISTHKIPVSRHSKKDLVEALLKNVEKK